jgi:hypothetical protein
MTQSTAPWKLKSYTTKAIKKTKAATNNQAVLMA